MAGSLEAATPPKPVAGPERPSPEKCGGPAAEPGQPGGGEGPGEAKQQQRLPAEEEELRRDGLERLRAALLGAQGARFEFPNASFAALFGRPCGPEGCEVALGSPAEVRALLGEDCAAASVLARLVVRHGGAGSAEVSSETIRGQSSLEKSLVNGTRPTTQSTAAAAAASAAAASRVSAFVIDSESEEEEAEPVAKRPRAGLAS
mmetsp:Transcript_125397/g.366303  ORF Transcript_125397/g.366303 Transcript_125397/m.366303 type:complete len:204 (+) Transcript_125397:36-647(+)